MTTLPLTVLRRFETASARERRRKKKGGRLAHLPDLLLGHRFVSIDTRRAGGGGWEILVTKRESGIPAATIDVLCSVVIETNGGIDVAARPEPRSQS